MDLSWFTATNIALACGYSGFGSTGHRTLGCQDKNILHLRQVRRYFIFVTYTKDISIQRTPKIAPSSRFSHVHHTPDAIPCLHILERSIDLVQWLPVCDELIHLELARHIVVHQVRELRATFDAAESASFPYAAGDELEC